MIIVEIEGNAIEIPKFDREEFDCKCGCGFNNINDRFLLKLHFARMAAGIPFIINSGCRCKKHNQALVKDPNTPHVNKKSEHMYGQAADVKCLNSRDRWIIQSAAYKAGFMRVGTHKKFIHLGDKPDYPQRVSFLY